MKSSVARSGRMVFERLPEAVRPENYKLQLQPDLEKLTFDGEEIITLVVKETIDKIIVNAHHIKIQHAQLQAGDKAEHVTVEYLVKDEKIVFGLKKPIEPGTYQLKLGFSGVLNNEMRGFYATKHVQPDGSMRNGALTHFEATGARWAFPCFDEPAIRATFDVTLTVPSSRVALSNMPKESETPHATTSHWKVVRFQTTPVMPTYLVAFVVGDYHRTRSSDEDGVHIEVYTPVGKSEQGVYATKVAAKTLPFYKNYFGVAYNLPKLDLVAAPDFPIGAMENWGLVIYCAMENWGLVIYCGTVLLADAKSSSADKENNNNNRAMENWGLVIYRETALLVDAKSSSAVKEYVALIIGHELAHNWFGNLVTMNWWTHLWLKEGFASWIEYLCVDHCFPEFDIWTQFIANDLFRALRLDALESSHPIEIEVGNPAEVDEIFDAISYSKGAAIINMLHDYIGDEDFRRGLGLYLQRHQLGSACTEDLWRALEEASGKPVGVTMATWTAQKGFPVLTVTEEHKDEGKQELKITQEKFSLTENQSGGASLWAVPVSIVSGSGEVQKVLMDKPTISVTVDTSWLDWVKLNAGTKGVYRVQYSWAMLSKMIPCLKEQTMGPTDRLGIISDLFALADVGRVSAKDLLNVVRAFQGETNYTVWKELTTNLSFMLMSLQYSPEVYTPFHQFVMNLLKPVYSSLGCEESENEDHLVAKLRDLVVGFLGVGGEKSAMNWAFAAFSSHVEGKSSIPSNIRKAVYSTVIGQGTMEHYSQLKKLHEETDSPEEKGRIRSAFSCAKDTAVLQDALNFAVSESVKSQDSPIAIGHIGTGSAKGRELAWTFFKDNYQMLYQRYSSSLLLARLVKTITEGFASEEKAAEIEAFFKKHPAPSAERTVQQSCEHIRLGARWLQREADNIAKYLKENPLPVPSCEGEGEKQRGKLQTGGSGKGEDRFAGIVVELPDK
ncbi:hypothetical protein ACOMHN_058883 [Nucella lapillus]